MDNGRLPDGLVSVVIVVHEWSPLASSSISSALSQGAIVDKVVVVANGISVPEGFLLQHRYKVVIVKSTDAVTVSEARNLGLNCVKSPFLAILDSDDVYLPGHLHNAVRALTSASASICCCAYQEMGLRGGLRRPPKQFSVRNLLARCDIGHSTIVAVASAYGRYPRENQRHDLALWLTLVRRGVAFVASDHVGVKRTVRAGSYSNRPALALAIVQLKVYVKFSGLTLLESVFAWMNFIFGQLRRRFGI